MFAVSYIDENIVIAAGGVQNRQAGLPRYHYESTNGGINWTQQASAYNVLYDVAFIDSYIGAAVGFGGKILRTTNGGITWFSQNSGTYADLFGVALADVNTEIAVGRDNYGYGIILNYERRYDLDATNKYLSKCILSSVAFINNDIGIVVGGTDS